MNYFYRQFTNLGIYLSICKNQTILTVVKILTIDLAISSINIRHRHKIKI